MHSIAIPVPLAVVLISASHRAPFGFCFFPLPGGRLPEPFLRCVRAVVRSVDGGHLPFVGTLSRPYPRSILFFESIVGPFSNLHLEVPNACSQHRPGSYTQTERPNRLIAHGDRHRRAGDDGPSKSPCLSPLRMIPQLIGLLGFVQQTNVTDREVLALVCKMFGFARTATQIRVPGCSHHPEL